MTDTFYSITLDERIDLADLTGSEKQVSWASDIRAYEINMVEERMRQLIRAGKAGNQDKAYAQAGQVITHLAAKDSAKFWIDNRGQDFARLAATEIVSR